MSKLGQIISGDPYLIGDDPEAVRLLRRAALKDAKVRNAVALPPSISLLGKRLAAAATPGLRGAANWIGAHRLPFAVGAGLGAVGAGIDAGLNDASNHYNDVARELQAQRDAERKPPTPPALTSPGVSGKPTIIPARQVAPPPLPEPELPQLPVTMQEAPMEVPQEPSRPPAYGQPGYWDYIATLKGNNAPASQWLAPQNAALDQLRGIPSTVQNWNERTKLDASTPPSPAPSPSPITGEEEDMARARLMYEANQARQQGRISNDPAVRAMAGVRAAAPPWMYDADGNMRPFDAPLQSYATINGGAVGDAYVGVDPRKERDLQGWANVAQARQAAAAQQAKQQQAIEQEMAARIPTLNDNTLGILEQNDKRRWQRQEDIADARSLGMPRPKLKSELAIAANLERRRNSPRAEQRMAQLAARQAKVSERAMTRREMRDFRLHGTLPSNPLLQAMAVGGPEAAMQWAQQAEQNKTFLAGKRLENEGNLAVVKAKSDAEMAQLQAQVNALNNTGFAPKKEDIDAYKAAHSEATGHSVMNDWILRLNSEGKLTPQQQKQYILDTKDGIPITTHARADWQDVWEKTQHLGEGAALKLWINRGYTPTHFNAMIAYDLATGAPMWKKPSTFTAAPTGNGQLGVNTRTPMTPYNSAGGSVFNNVMGLNR